MAYMVCKHCFKKYSPDIDLCPKCGRLLVPVGSVAEQRIEQDIRGEIYSANEYFAYGYPVARFLARALLFLGIVQIGLALFIVFMFIVAGGEIDLRALGLLTPKSSALVSFFLSTISFVAWLWLLILGVLTIAASEIMRMFFDIHDDISRTSDVFYALSVYAIRNEK